MIGYVDGVLDYLTEECAVVDVNGIGINVYISGTTLSKLPPLGEHIRLYTYTCVREDAFLLYGFLNRADLEMFKKCITVSGIGPKGALALLSVFSNDELRFAILSDDAKTISKAPGIGLKTAQRLILELKGKLEYTENDISREISHGADNSNANSEIKEAIAALVSLGYSQTESSQAINKISDVEQMDAGQILKAALKYLF